jgi:hypothetical protein
MSIELATDTLGSAITAASSYDFKHPPSQIIDGKPNTYWLSTGLYPQEFILQLGKYLAISKSDHIRLSFFLHLFYVLVISSISVIP